MSGFLPTERILGYPVTTVSLDRCLAGIGSMIEAGSGPYYLACANPHSLMVARHDPAFSAALLAADIVVPDGVGVCLASRLLGGSIRHRITGMDIFLGVHRLLQDRGGGRVFFLGASESTLDLIRRRMERDYSHISICGVHAPPFKKEFSAHDQAIMREAINQACPDVLWVGMTAPKQEKWIHANRAHLNVKFIAAVGAVFDFYSGRVRRAPPLAQRLGVEWLLRLLQEPRRLWRRNLNSPLFLLEVLKYGREFR